MNREHSRNPRGLVDAADLLRHFIRSEDNTPQTPRSALLAIECYWPSASTATLHCKKILKATLRRALDLGENLAQPVKLHD